MVKFMLSELLIRLYTMCLVITTVPQCRRHHAITVYPQHTCNSN